jgi:Flp pilus assembly pilin Flp
MTTLYWTLRNFLERPREEGQTLTEYALILVLIVIVAIVVMTTLGNQIKNVFTNITTELSGVAGT